MAGRGKGSRSRSRSRSKGASPSGSGGGCGPCFCWSAGGRPGERLGLGDLLQAASGERHYLLLLSHGAVRACGDNSCGQLGRPGGHEKQPVPISAGKSLQFAFVSCGKDHSLAISCRGKVFAWGANSEGQLGVNEVKDSFSIPREIKSLSDVKIIQVSCGDHHSLALSEDSQLFSWGSNSHGQLGLGKNGPSQKSPQLVKSLQGVPLVQVAAGGTHSFALSLSGTSFAWGRNNAGQLALTGKKVNERALKPYPVKALQGLGVTYISCGGEHTAVLTQDEKVFTFGDNTYGQLGHSSARSGPQAVERVGGLVSQIDCGSKHTLVYVYTTGQVVSFGCGPSHTSNPTHPEVLAENSNINCLISADDPEDVQVKHIFAGTYANFVTTYQAKSPRIPKKTIPEIRRINKSLTEKWISMTRAKSSYKEVESTIETVFSSPACLTASFLKKREPEESISIGVDLQMARDTFNMLTKNKMISSMITSSLSENLLKNLPYHSRHQEALLVFLLLPECPAMHESSNWNSLIVPFAKALYKMSPESLLILEQWWKSLQASALSTLVRMLKTALICQLEYWSQTSQTKDNARALLEVMKTVYKVNKKANCQLPESTFRIDQLSDCLDFFHERAVTSLRSLNLNVLDVENVLIFSDYPFVFNLASKIKLWKAESCFKMISMESLAQWWPEFLLGILESRSSPCFELKVNKSHLVEDTLRQLCSAGYTDLHKELAVGFIGQVCPKTGGVVSEFFHAIFEEMTAREYGMFFYPENGPYMWFPTCTSSLQYEIKKKYYLFGILCGLSLYNGNVANIPFPLALFKKLRGQKPSLEDLIELSPQLGKSLQKLLNYEADDIEDLNIYFAIHWNENDADLIPDGSCTLVDHARKEDYVSECVNYIFNTSVSVVFEEFQRGFFRVCDRSFLTQFFQPKELMQAIIGNTDYDWELFEKNSTYTGYSSSDRTIKLFWKVFHNLSLEEKKKFLFFLTGNDRLQERGLMNFGIHFRYSELLHESDNLRSLICHHILDLPRYSTKKRMEEALQIAIKSNTGFDFTVL